MLPVPTLLRFAICPDAEYEFGVTPKKGLTFASRLFTLLAL